MTVLLIILALAAGVTIGFLFAAMLATSAQEDTILRAYLDGYTDGVAGSPSRQALGRLAGRLAEINRERDGG